MKIQICMLKPPEMEFTQIYRLQIWYYIFTIAASTPVENLWHSKVYLQGCPWDIFICPIPIR